MSTIFFISFVGGMIMLILGLIRLVANNAAAIYKHDGKTAARKRKDKGVVRHFIITGVLFLIAALTVFS